MKELYHIKGHHICKCVKRDFAWYEALILDIMTTSVLILHIHCSPSILLHCSISVNTSSPELRTISNCLLKIKISEYEQEMPHSQIKGQLCYNALFLCYTKPIVSFLQWN